MNALFDAEIELILWLRSNLPGLEAPFTALTFLGNEMFYLVFLPIVYWCLDRATGARMTLLFLLSVYLNTAVKVIADLPRPFDYAADRVAHLFTMGVDAARELYEAGGNGFPSGHTQNTVTVWGYLAAVVARLTPPQPRRALTRPRRLFVGLAALLIILVPLSRLYLAVHFAHDLIGGYAIGVLLLGAYLCFAPSIETRLSRRPLFEQLGLAGAVPLAMMVVLPWETAVTAAATLLGMSAGFALERNWVHFDSAGPWWRRGLRLVMGLAVLLALYVGLSAAFGALDWSHPTAPLLRAIRYTTIGLWGSFGAPWAFVKLGLARQTDPQTNREG